MSITSQVNSLMQEITISHQARLTTIADLRKETQQSLETFRRARAKMADEQKQSLAVYRADCVDSVQKMRARNIKGQEQTAAEVKTMAGEVAAFLATSHQERQQKFATTLGEIKGVVETIKKDTTQTLADLRSERKKMAKTLKMGLSTGTRERREVVHDLLVDFSSDHRQALAHWKHSAKEAPAPRADKPAFSTKTEMNFQTPVQAAPEKKGENRRTTKPISPTKTELHTPFTTERATVERSSAEKKSESKKIESISEGLGNIPVTSQEGRDISSNETASENLSL